MNAPDNQHQNFGPEHFAGWPATVPAERLERAIQYVQERMRVQPDMQELPTSGDADLDMDMFLTAHSMLSPHHITQVDLTPLDDASDEDFLPALRHILEGLETEHHFACAIIDNIAADQFSTETTIAIRDIFTLAKHPDWMGISISLPNLQGHHVHTIESKQNPGNPAAMFAVPDIMMAQPTPGDTPSHAGRTQSPGRSRRLARRRILPLVPGRPTGLTQPAIPSTTARRPPDMRG